MILVIPVRVEDDSNSVKSPKKKKTKSMFADSKKIISTLKTRCLISINCTPKNSHSSLKKWDSKKTAEKNTSACFPEATPWLFLASFLHTSNDRPPCQSSILLNIFTTHLKAKSGRNHLEIEEFGVKLMKFIYKIIWHLRFSAAKGPIPSWKASVSHIKREVR